MGLKARALFIGLAGALVTALLLSAAPNRPEPANDSFVAHTQGAMAPATWQEVYAQIAERNANEQGRRERTILERERALSPLNWGVLDRAVSVHAEEDDDWVDTWPSDSNSGGRLDVTRDVTPLTRGRGWAAAVGGGSDVVASGQAEVPNNTTSRKRELEPFDPWSITWTRSPTSKRLRRTAEPRDDDDPWRDIVQPHWGGDWTRHQGGHWWTSEEQAGRPEMPVTYTWPLQAQPAWGGSWA